jgi:hypothetical protein
MQDRYLFHHCFDDIWAIQDFEIQEAMEDPITFVTSSSPDTMYLHEALKAPYIESNSSKQWWKRYKPMKTRNIGNLSQNLMLLTTHSFFPQCGQ